MYQLLDPGFIGLIFSCFSEDSQKVCVNRFVLFAISYKTESVSLDSILASGCVCFRLEESK